MLRHLALFLFWTVSAFAAGSGPVPVTQLGSLVEADAFARRLVEAERSGNTEPIQVLHAGTAIPTELKWVLLHLEKAGIPFELHLVSPAEFERTLEQGRARLLEYGDGPESARAQGLWQRASVLASYVFGLPKGITFWMKLNRSPRQRLVEGAISVAQAAIGGLSMGASMYLAQSQGMEIRIAPAVGFMVAWIAAHCYWSRLIGEWMGQGRAVKEVQPGEFRVVRGKAFFYANAAWRSVLINAIVTGAAFGFDRLGQPGAAGTMLENAAINLTARTWVDQWINGHQASTLPDGTVVVKQGQWRPMTSVAVNTVWNLAYGLIKNLHLLEYGSFTRWTFAVMGVAGAMKITFDERHSIARLLKKMRGAAGKSRCATLLLR
jgi:hypothetical protein